MKKTSEQEIREGLPGLFPRVWRYALVLTANKDHAFDVAQATCLRALEKCDAYEPGTHLDRWLFRMAHRIWLNELRATAIRRGGGLQSLDDIEIPDTKCDAETNYFVRQVLSTVNTLPEAQRICVFLVYIEGLKYAEAAEVLSIPIGTVMSRLAAARRTVAMQLIEKSEAS